MIGFKDHEMPKFEENMNSNFKSYSLLKNWMNENIKMIL